MMRDVKRLLLLLWVVGVQGCSLFAPQPVQNSYSLHVGNNPFGGGAGKGMLSVSPLTINQKYENQGFVYHLAGSATKTDYYHQFQSAPEVSVTDLLKKWLREGRQFQVVGGLNQAPGADYLLSGTVHEIYGDYADPRAPVAVVNLRIYLTKGSEPSITYRKSLGTYESRIPVSPNTPDGLVSAWNQGLEQCFRQIERDLASATR